MEKFYPLTLTKESRSRTKARFAGVFKDTAEYGGLQMATTCLAWGTAAQGHAEGGTSLCLDIRTAGAASCGSAVDLSGSGCQGCADASLLTPSDLEVGMQAVLQ